MAAVPETIANPDMQEVLQAEGIGGIFQNIDISGLHINLHHILQALILLVICLITIRIILHIFNKTGARLNMDSSLRHLIHAGLKILLYSLTFLIVVGSLGVPVNSLLAVFGVVGLALSLAAQNSLGKLAGGLMILATKPFKVGDFIEAVGDISGTVQQIGLAYTRVRTPDNKIIMVPNSSISNEIVTNFSMEDKRRCDINIRIAYIYPIEDVKNALRAALAEQENILDDPPPLINVFSYEDNSIQYTCRAWVPTSVFWPTRFSLLEKVKHSLDAQGIDMHYNNLHVQLLAEAADAGKKATRQD